jgi:glycogen debranching enzyme
VAHLRDPREFWRPFVFPTLAADDPHYESDGSYWLGGVWAPTNYVIIKGLERYGQEDLATQATDRYLTAMAEVFRQTGTVWENYAPEEPLRPGNPSKAGLVGWSGDGPIALLIENMLGFRSDGVRHRLVWRLTRTDRHGIERLHVGAVTVSAVCAARPSPESPAEIVVTNDAPLDLSVWSRGREHLFPLPAGSHELEVR